MENTLDKGSYDFGGFTEGGDELERLKVQALQCWDREREMLLRGGLRPEMRVLDAGCGPGFVSAAVADLMSTGEVVGLEPDPSLAEAARHSAASQPKFSVKEGSVYAAPFADNEFDLIYTRFLFQHLQRPAEALAELKRILKPGGRLLIVDIDDALLIVEPEPEGLHEFVTIARRAQAEKGGDRFIGRKLPGLLKEAGFADVLFEVPSITSQELGLESFLKIISGYKLYISNSETSARLLEKIKEQSLQMQSIGTVGVFFAHGQK